MTSITTKICPSDIISPIGQKFVFSKVVNDETKAIALAILVNASQRDGKNEWVYSNSFPEEYKWDLDSMKREGIIDEREKQYRPTPETINRLFEHYPCTK